MSLGVPVTMFVFDALESSAPTVVDAPPGVAGWVVVQPAVVIDTQRMTGKQSLRLTALLYKKCSGNYRLTPLMLDIPASGNAARARRLE